MTGFRIIEYGIGLLNYYLVYRIIFGAEFQRSILKLLMAILLPAGLTMLAVRYGFDGTGLVVVLCIGAVMLLAEKNRLRMLVLFPIAFFLTGTVNIGGTYIISLIMGMKYYDFIETPFYQMIAELTCPVVLIVIGIVMRGGSEDELISFSTPKYFLTLAGTICLFVIIAMSQGIMQEQEKIVMKYRVYFSYAVVCVGILFLILIIWQLVIEKKVDIYRSENEAYQTYIEKQEAHIRDMIEADQRVRSFRHDIKAHITALENGVSEGNLAELRTYIERMKGEVRRFDIRKYTNIAAVDAVISEWNQKALDKEISWNWEGEIHESVGIEAFDLCVIFSNLLSNAVEAACRIDDKEKRYIDIRCYSYQGNLYIQVDNSCRQDITDESVKKTEKEDRRNHGFGIKNIRRIVEKVSGTYRSSADAGVFHTEIIV